MNKQIEEMAKCCRYYEGGMCRNPRSRQLMCDPHHCQDGIVFKKLVEYGYRKASDVAREIICDIVDPVWRAYQNSENEMTSLLAAFICEYIITKIKQKYESEGADGEN